MARLPNPGLDDGVWGEILNDFLGVSHNSDGTLKSSSITAAGAASDVTVIHVTGDEAVAGIKTFSSSPIVPTPSTGTQAANKSYVDSAASAGAPDATTSGKGIVQLAGDLAGTAASPTVPGLASKASTSRQIIAGTGLTGGGDLTADRTLTVSYGTDPGTAAQGNDSRITGAVQASTVTASGDLLVGTGSATVGRLGIGSSGQVLAVSGGAPSWVSNAPISQLDSGDAFGDRYQGSSTQNMDSGVLHLTYFRASKSETITKVLTYIGGGNGSGLTLTQIGVFSVAANGDLTLIASTDPAASLWTSQYTTYNTNFQSSWSKTAGNIYAVGLLAIGSAMPWQSVCQLFEVLAALPPRINGRVNSQSSMPSSVTSGSITTDYRMFMGAVLP